MNTTTRRTILAGAAALPLLPAAALAVPVTLPLLPVSALATPADPAVEASRVCRAAFIAYVRSFDRPNLADDDPIMLAAQGADWAAKVRLASVIATSPAGLAGQLRVGLGIFGDLVCSESRFEDPAAYQFDNCRDDMDGRLYRNMLAGAEGMAA